MADTTTAQIKPTQQSLRRASPLSGCAASNGSIATKGNKTVSQVQTRRPTDRHIGY